MTWELVGSRAGYEKNGWGFSFDQNQPQRGLQVSSSRGVAPAAAWTLCAFQPVPGHSARLEEAYVRGSDLIVRYAQTAADQFGFQLDWRILPHDDLGGFDAGVELWLSVQTQLLDTHPKFILESSAQSGQWQRLRAAELGGSNEFATGGGPMHTDEVAALAESLPGGTAAVLVHPSDQLQTTIVSHHSKHSSGLQMLGGFMEKGVIRRARLRCVVSHKTLGHTELASAYLAFSESALPLTA
ncbi:MAG: hypothetical protein U0892_07730 [Pirellulales bacterium]